MTSEASIGQTPTSELSFKTECGDILMYHKEKCAGKIWYNPDKQTWRPRFTDCRDRPSGWDGIEDNNHYFMSLESAMRDATRRWDNPPKGE